VISFLASKSESYRKHGYWFPNPSRRERALFPIHQSKGYRAQSIRPIPALGGPVLPIHRPNCRIKLRHPNAATVNATVSRSFLQSDFFRCPGFRSMQSLLERANRIHELPNRTLFRANSAIFLIHPVRRRFRGIHPNPYIPALRFLG